MSETKTQSRTLVTPVGWSSSLILVRAVRIAQFVFTVITLGLTGHMVDYYWSNSIADYGVATSVLSLVYLISIFFATWFAGAFFMAGPLLLCEILLLILWFAAFIALAAEYGDGSCRVGGYFYPRSCRTGQAAIAMAAISMALYAFSLALLVINSVRPIINSYGSQYLWRTASTMQSTFDQGTGLLLLGSSSWVPDPETGLTDADRQITASSVESPVAAEKVTTQQEPAEPTTLTQPAVTPIVDETP